MGTTRRAGTKVTFKADTEIFGNIECNYDIIAARLRELAFLNKGLKITFEDERSQKPVATFEYEGGIVSFVEHLNTAKKVMDGPPIYIHHEKDTNFVECATSDTTMDIQRRFFHIVTISIHSREEHISQGLGRRLLEL